MRSLLSAYREETYALYRWMSSNIILGKQESIKIPTPSFLVATLMTWLWDRKLTLSSRGEGVTFILRTRFDAD